MVGDFDEAEVAALAAELFGDWKSPAPFARVPQLYQDVPPIDKALETPDKANAFFIAGQNLQLRDDDPGLSRRSSSATTCSAAAS